MIQHLDDDQPINNSLLVLASFGLRGDVPHANVFAILEYEYDLPEPEMAALRVQIFDGLSPEEQIEFRRREQAGYGMDCFGIHFR